MIKMNEEHQDLNDTLSEETNWLFLHTRYYMYSYSSVSCKITFSIKKKFPHLFPV